MLPESDWHLLEAYLDDALSATEVQRLDLRLSDENELADALDALKSDRAGRIAVFNALAPSEAEAGRFSDKMLATLRRRQMLARVRRNLRLICGIAACLLVGFFAGWIGRGHGDSPQVVIAPARLPASVVSPSHPRGDSHLILHAPKAAEPGQYQVAVLDADGNVIALQRFSNVDDARQFSDDLQQFELRRHQIQDGQAMLVSDSF